MTFCYSGQSWLTHLLTDQTVEAFVSFGFSSLSTWVDESRWCQSPWRLEHVAFGALYTNGLHLLLFSPQPPHHIPFTPTGNLTAYPIRAQFCLCIPTALCPGPHSLQRHSLGVRAPGDTEPTIISTNWSWIPNLLHCAGLLQSKLRRPSWQKTLWRSGASGHKRQWSIYMR